ncbi:class I SAM-dependent methyltransferase [Amphritea sp.]|uniref:class I SAM-dependent methyltransferase n=1 Tax=Amphritea sp. TaxID=1872502 RepID=UPI0025C6CA3F|nr:class I SAM-dependent methyltransferase [Amphritea sp.]
MVNSTDFYEQNAQSFFDSTVDVDMSELYDRFLPLVPDGGLILDAGCGSGRDSLTFQDRGYSVIAIDASESLCELASVLLGKSVDCMRFNEIKLQGVVDAVWACASLLHVPKNELSGSILALIRSLKPSGVMYCSFKLGDQERLVDGRFFSDMTDESFRALMRDVSPGVEVETWVTEDQRPDRNESWLNVLIKLDD